MRTRLTFIAKIPGGVDIESVRASIDRAKSQVLLTGDFIEELSQCETSMCELFFDDPFLLCQPYQDTLNRKVDNTFKIIGRIPTNIEVENNFVHYRTNQPLFDPVQFGYVNPGPRYRLAIDACVAHLHILSVCNDNARTDLAWRPARNIFSPQRNQVPQQPRAFPVQPTSGVATNQVPPQQQVPPQNQVPPQHQVPPQQQVPPAQAQRQQNMYAGAGVAVGYQAGGNVPPAQPQQNYAARNVFKRGRTN